MKITIEILDDAIHVKLDGKTFWRGTYLEGALEAARKELVRIFGSGNPKGQDNHE